MPCKMYCHNINKIDAQEHLKVSIIESCESLAIDKDLDTIGQLLYTQDLADYMWVLPQTV